MQRFVRIAPAALLALAAACAASPDPGISPNNQTTSQVFTGTEGLPTTVSTDAPVTSSVNTAIRPDTALLMLQAAYAANGIEVTLIEPREGRIGNPRFIVRGSLNREPLSHYVTCGRTINGERADRDQIQMSVVTTVRPGPNGGSVIATLLTASAQDRTSGVVGDMMPCSTRGALESKIHRAAFGTG